MDNTHFLNPFLVRSRLDLDMDNTHFLNPFLEGSRLSGGWNQKFTAICVPPLPPPPPSSAEYEVTSWNQPREGCVWHN